MQSAPAALPPAQAARVCRMPPHVSNSGKNKMLINKRRIKKRAPDKRPMGRILRPTRFAVSRLVTKVPGMQQSAVIVCEAYESTPFEISMASRNVAIKVTIMPITANTSITGRTDKIPVLSLAENKSLFKINPPESYSIEYILGGIIL